LYDGGSSAVYDTMAVSSVTAMPLGEPSTTSNVNDAQP
jgi:hypothetical protein